MCQIFILVVKKHEIKIRQIPWNSAKSDTLYRLFQNSRLTEAIHQLISHSSQDWSRRWNGPNLIVYHMNVSVGCWGIYLSQHQNSKKRMLDGRLVKNCLISYSSVEITCFLSSKSRLKNMLLWRKTRQATIMMDGQGKIIHLISEKKVAKLS